MATKTLKNVSGSELTITDLKLTLANNEEFPIDESGWVNPSTSLVVDDFINSPDTLTAINANDLDVGDGTNWYSGKDAELYLKSKHDDDNYILDGSDLSEFTPEVVTDADTGKKGMSTFMNVLTMMREFYNTPTDPLYDSNFQPLLGVDGREEEALGRISNLENIHGATGWHEKQVKQANFSRPDDLLIYYGYPNSFNSGVNAWNNEAVAQDMAKYNHIILGDGVQAPTHPDYSNTQIIIPRVKALNQYVKIWGYVTANQTLANFKTKVDQWNTLAVSGIFMDECGYDYGKTRDEFNEMVDYVHGKSVSNLCFVNAWNMDNIIGLDNDASYPNSTYNHFMEESHLTVNDWYLLESFPINTTAYSGTGGYESKSDWTVRGSKAIAHRYTYGINLAGVGIINNANGSGQDLFDFQFISAMMWSLDANGTSDTSYGASSATVTFWTRPDISDMGRLWVASTSVQNDVGDADVYWRFVDFGKFMLDFSSSAQDSSITKW
jgi:hypothetical protein